VGPFSYFRDRRARESAASTSELSIDTGPPLDEQPVATTELNSLGDIGALLSQFRQFQTAADHGSMEVNGQVIDLRGSGLRQEILDAMEQHGADGTQQGTPIVVSAIPGFPEEILDALGRYGVDLGELGVERIPGEADSLPTEGESPDPADGPQIRDPFSGR